jgi:hypothetical protein
MCALSVKAFVCALSVKAFMCTFAPESLSFPRLRPSRHLSTIVSHVQTLYYSNSSLL